MVKPPLRVIGGDMLQSVIQEEVWGSNIIIFHDVPELLTTAMNE
jgi:hypothetical protein